MPAKKGSRNCTEDNDHWIMREVQGSSFSDARLDSRFAKVLEQLWHGIGRTIPLACQEVAATKAAYRFFSNEKVDPATLLAGHFEATKARFAAVESSTVLILHDTSEFVYNRHEDSPLGLLGRSYAGRTKEEGMRLHTQRGVLMHSSLVVTMEGLPLGLAAIKFWSRKEFKGTSLKDSTRFPIEEKESIRWLENIRASNALLNQPARCVHIGDRESDIYDLFCAAHEAGSCFLVRACTDRAAEEGMISEQMAEAPPQGTHRIGIKDASGKPSEVSLEIKHLQLTVKRPGKSRQKGLPHLALTVIHATEINCPAGREPLVWKLMTNLSVTSLDEAIEKLEWYAMRWKIETFHKILKSGCKAEEAKLRTTERLANLIAIYCIISWRIFWLTMLNRATPHAPARIAFTENEIKIMDKLIRSKTHAAAPKTIADYLRKLAMLGGYLGRAKDAPPGNTVIWRGLTRLVDIQVGFDLAGDTCG
jgi:hypothetical protein